MAFQISLTSNSSEIIREYREGIPLKGAYEVGLKHLVFWDSIYNVTSKNNTLHLMEPIRHADGRVTYENKHIISIAPGLYEIDDIIAAIEKNNFADVSATEITVVANLLKICIFSRWGIDFTHENSIGQILGFSRQILNENETHYSDLPVRISAINTIKISCNLIRANIEDFKRNVNTLYDFPLDPTRAGGKIIKEPNPICYFTINTDKIYELVIKITDQSDNLIDFRGELINLTLDFRPYGYQNGI